MIFISYSQRDQAPYSSLCLALENEKLAYWSSSSMKAGASLKDQLREAIAKCDACIFIATQRSIESKWCLAETGAFWGAGKQIILYKANPDIDLPPLFYGDLWTCDVREILQQVKEIPEPPKDRELPVTIEQISQGYSIAQASGFDPYMQRSRDALMEYKSLLDDIGRGYMMTEVGGKYAYGRKGTTAARETVKAVEYGSINAWRTEHLKDVIRVNSEAVKRGVQIHRVFILKRESTTGAKDVLDEHKNAGVQVFTVAPEDLPRKQLLESYLVVDDTVLVVFYFTVDGEFREEKIVTNQFEVDRYINNYDSIFRRATMYE